MSNRDVITRSGAGASVNASQNDQNMNSFAGTTEQQSGTTYTVVYTDQGKTIELNNAAMVCTLDDIATIAAAIDTDNWKVTLKNINAAAATVQRSGTDTIDGATSLSLAQYEAVTLHTDTTGGVWNIVGREHDVSPFSTTQSWAKGADVASASALAVDAGDGNYFDVTGTTTVTSLNTVGIGTQIKLHFDGALTLTHHATDLVLPGGANITTAAGDEAEFVEYASGDWRCTSYTKADGAAVTAPPDVGIRDRARGLNITRPTVSTVTITADEVMLQDGSNNSYRATGVSETADITASGADGLDTGTEATDDIYYIWLIYNGTAVASLLSASESAPTMPSGYTYKALVGAVLNVSGDFVDFEQIDNTVALIANQTLINGSMIKGAWTSISMATIVPSTAMRVDVVVGAVGGNIHSVGFSPFSGGHGGLYGHPFPGLLSNDQGAYPRTAYNLVSGSVLHKPTMYYWIGNAGSAENAFIMITGWEY